MINSKELINKYLDLIKKFSFKEVLDLGCGNCKILIELNEEKVKLTGVDLKEIKPNKFKNFKFIKEDIKNFKFNKEYDLIIINFVLHFLKKEEAYSLLNKIKQSTSKNGLNLISCLTYRDPFFKEGNFYPNLNELKIIYKDWEIIKCDEDFTEIEQHDSLKPHQHNITII